MSQNQHRVQNFADLFRAFPVATLVKNLNTVVNTITVNDQCFPITLNDADADRTCYICCPTRAYIDYAIDETRHFISHPTLQKATRGVIKTSVPLLRASRLDHQVQVNNWLLSTNPMPAITDAVPLRDTLQRTYPDRAIVIRSLNHIADAETIVALRRAGFQVLPARMVYIADRLSTDRMTNNMKHDRRLLRKTKYRLVENGAFTDTDYVAAERLYTQLYLDKYTPLNPQYTALYIREMHKQGLFSLMGLRDVTGRLVAVTGLFENAGTLTQPIVGYDTDLPQSHGLYRMIMALGQNYAMEQGLFFHMSAGAASFKRLRGAVPTVEYTAVYVGHLPVKQRLAVRVMQQILTRIGIPLLKRFAL